MTRQFSHSIYNVLVAALLILAMAAVTFTGCFLVSGYREGRFGDTNENNTAYLSLTEGFTTLTVKSREGALNVAASVADDLGLNDAAQELKVSAVRSLDGNRYYRLQQYYEGLPVFGRTVVVGADESGRSVTLNANTVSVSDRLKTTPKTTAEQAADIARKAVLQESGARAVDLPDVSADDLCVYNFTDNGADRLAYEVRCSTPVGSYKVFVDALDGTVLDLYSTTCAQAAICYDVEGKQLTGDYNEKLQKYVLGNESQGLYIYTLEGKNYYQGANGTYVRSDDNVFGNTDEEMALEYNKATRLYNTLSTIRRYYKNTYGAQGDKVLIGMYNDAYDNGNNSFATDDILWKGDLLPVGTVVGVISIGIRQDGSAVDLLAHEYMHRVEQNMVGLLYRGESGSIMEAYSDIFGELVEGGLSGESPDWIHNDVRDLVNPEVHGYPTTYQGRYFASGSETDNGAVHRNSTVLSHAAYLMWNGIDGSRNARLDSQTLGKLWLNALQKFTARETFEQCAQTIYETALAMDLSAQQVDCVARAFQKAGLPVRDKDKAAASRETTTTTTTAPTVTLWDPSVTQPVGSDEPAPSQPDAVGDNEPSAPAQTVTAALPDPAEPTTASDDVDSVG
ncbi:MAG: M4 family metallopeptidase [Clostridia bacterium]|nr:M4 family metallopeptidase [Clostridia bacterium]